ncbi:beta-1,3-galactosyltransferase 5-like [Saccoglossus kowalevskii]|uniref:Hexosyltransferase n=1 Tax=Saccoglossus kowalevskii TaxID=10224 RepID=A0ABM0MNI7_SACKO|nr:PREDICTED: beta-1,3-galactosyltransferase 1-like [Saccoglossus kowalevskii]
MPRVRPYNTLVYALLATSVLAFFRLIMPAIEDSILFGGRDRWKVYYFRPDNASTADFNQSTLGYCHDSVFLITMVITHHDNWVQRMVIRETWGGVKKVSDKTIVNVFVLAQTNNKVMANRLRQENEEHHDMVVLNFKDHYLNLTLKTLQSLYLVTKYCPAAEYILKADDDVFINYFSLVPFLSKSPRKDYAVGFKHYKATPVRWRKSKWFTPKHIYRERVYPPYLAGTAYVMSRDVALRVHNVATAVTFLPWEDVFVGLCMRKLKITPLMDKRFDTHGREYIQNRTCPIHRIFSIHHVEPRNITDLWKRYHEEEQDARCHNKYHYTEMLSAKPLT